MHILPSSKVLVGIGILTVAAVAGGIGGSVYSLIRGTPVRAAYILLGYVAVTYAVGFIRLRHARAAHVYTAVGSDAWYEFIASPVVVPPWSFVTLGEAWNTAARKRAEAKAVKTSEPPQG